MNTSVVITVDVRNGLVKDVQIYGYQIPDQVCSNFTKSLGHWLTLLISVQVYVPQQWHCMILVPLSLVSALRKVTRKSSNAA